MLPKRSTNRALFRERRGAGCSPPFNGNSILSAKPVSLRPLACFIICNKLKLTGVTKRGQVCPIPCPVPPSLRVLSLPAGTSLRSSREKHCRINVHLLMRQRLGEQFWHNCLSELGDGENDLESSEYQGRFAGILAPQVPANKWINVHFHKFAEPVSSSVG